MNEEKRKIFKNPIIIGLFLYVLNTIAFFIVYYFFMGVNYWNISMKTNAFVIPFLYVIVGFLSAYWNRESGKMTFLKAFRYSFITMFFGGFFSIFSIFIFLNYIDKDARDVLNYQYVELELKNLDDEYSKIKSEIIEIGDKDKLDELDKNYTEAKLAREIAMKEKRNYFSFNFLSVVFGCFVLFYILLSAVVAGFLRNKNSY